MNKSFAIAALLTATIGLGAAAPAFAQDATPAAPSQPQSQVQNPMGRMAPDRNLGPGRYGRGFEPGRGFGPGRGMMPARTAMGPAGLMLLSCSPRGAEALDLALVRMSYRLNLTDEQKPLFDAFRNNALAAQTKFADSCKAGMPAGTAGATPDVLQRLKSGLAVEQARVAALSSLLPDFESLYNGLTDTQKAALAPHHGRFAAGGKGYWGKHPSPRAPQQDAAPAPSATRS